MSGPQQQCGMCGVPGAWQCVRCPRPAVWPAHDRANGCPGCGSYRADGGVPYWHELWCLAGHGALPVPRTAPPGMPHGQPGHVCTWACPRATPLADIRNVMTSPDTYVVADGKLPGLFAGPVLNRRQRLAGWLRGLLHRPHRDWDGWVQLGAIDDTPDGFTPPIGDQPSDG